MIIPCWNGEAFVGEAIDSALGQTYPHLEVIVIDDGSSDGSLDVIRSFGARVRWETGPNRGACAARNRGLAMARGALIQFLDADDILLPEKLSRMVPVALSAGSQAMAICDGESERGGAAAEPMPLAYKGEDPVVFCLHRQLPTLSPLHWRENLERVDGFDESLPCSQERDLHLRLACAGLRFVHLPEALYKVRRQPGSLSAELLPILRQHRSIFARAYDKLSSAGDLTPARRAAFARALARDGRASVRFGEQALARAYFKQADAILPGAAAAVFGSRVLRAVAASAGPIAAERLCQLALSAGIRPHAR
ncbi:MAG TPA: glycosyltransferase [Afifellaceae bacterium]|nr:glycosyltransferase [Afifellaceae bacterium]